MLALAVTSCEKNESLEPRGETAAGASIKAMHLSPNAPALNILVDSTKTVGVLSTNSIESGMVFGNIFPSLSGGYAFIPGGQHTLSAKVPASSTTLPGQTITSKQFTFQEGKFYSVAIVDSLSRLDAVIVEDDLSIPDTSKSYFRIANFMNNGTADVELTNSAIPGFIANKNGLVYKSVSNFEEITAIGSYKVLLRANGSATRLDSITAFSPAKGRKYTLYTRGVVGQTGSSNTKRPLIFQMTNY